MNFPRSGPDFREPEFLEGEAYHTFTLGVRINEFVGSVIDAADKHVDKDRWPKLVEGVVLVWLNVAEVLMEQGARLGWEFRVSESQLKIFMDDFNRYLNSLVSISKMNFSKELKEEMFKEQIVLVLDKMHEKWGAK